MNKKTIILMVSLFVLIVVGMFVYAQLKKTELQRVEILPAEEQEPTVVPYADITRIDAKHYFMDGLHSLVGEINMPTPCDLLDTQAVVAESFPEQVTVEFSVINTAATCAQVITPQRFKVDFSASVEAPIRATFMGRDVELNLIPAAPGERPEDFELFLKG